MAVENLVMNTMELPPILRVREAKWSSLAMSGLTDQGCVRKDNQDSYVVDGEGRYAIVADGMGGHRGGALASQVASASVAEALEEAFNDESVRTSNDIETTLREGFRRAFREVAAAASKDPELASMGTTLLATALTGEGDLVVAHLGDSRFYRCRQGKINALTDDHTVLSELLRAGVLNPNHIAGNERLGHLLTRAVSPGSLERPDVFMVTPEPGDRYLLCSDGLYGVVSDSKIEELLHAHEAPEEACQALVAAARAHGAPDNVTVVLIEIPD